MLMANTLGKAKQGRNKPDFMNQHKEAIPRLVGKLIDEADIILEVLDSRFIEKTRNAEIEQKVKAQGKKLCALRQSRFHPYGANLVFGGLRYGI